MTKLSLKRAIVYLLAVLVAGEASLSALLINLRPVQASETPAVVINELMWMGSLIGGLEKTADEWIELRNLTSAPIGLQNWKLTKTVIGGGDLTIPDLPEMIIPESGYFLIANYASTNVNSILNVTPNLVTASLSLANACQPISLQLPDSTLADSVGCGPADSHLAGSNGSLLKQSMARNYLVSDGTLPTSWHTSVAFANLDSSASDANKATPLAVNDQTAPDISGLAVSDGQLSDQDFTADPTTLMAFWSGATEGESTVDRYEAALGTAEGLGDVVDYQSVTTTSYTFTVGLPPGWPENFKYFVSVRAVNSVGLVSDPVSSDGITLNTADPDPVANLAVTDTPNDNGGSLQISWNSSISPDVVGYQLRYRRQGTESWTTGLSQTTTSQTVSNLINQVVYEFQVQTTDFNQQTSLSSIVLGSALDNLAPQLAPDKITLNSQKPGTEDMIVGSTGAINEMGVTVNVFDRKPDQPGAILINSVVSQPDGSWPAMAIGDNRYASAWIQAVDQAGNSSSPLSLVNDIAGPNAPTLEKVTANCVSDTCRVTLEWSDNGPDTSYYQVSRTTDSLETRTFDLNSRTIALDLPTGQRFRFAIYAFDGYGNPSLKSNVLETLLTKGVKSTVSWVDGRMVTATEAISGSLEVVSAPAKTEQSVFEPIVPKAQAQTPTPTTQVAPETNGPQKTEETGQATDQDWVRIFVVILLLLIVAGSFYALSRTIGKEAESRESPAPEVKAEPKPRRHRGRSRRGGKA